MRFKTHLVIGIFASLIFYYFTSSIFSFFVLFSSLLPDFDTPFSKIGRNKFSRFAQLFTEHRGFVHSFTFLFFVCLVIVIFSPIISLAFFIGYSLHLIADSFTKSGITPFWPYSKKARGFIKTGGFIEVGVFFIFLFLNIWFLWFFLIG